jgi:peptide/nickel transport system permease protein
MQFLHYLGGLARGDFGESIRTYRDVRLDLIDFLPATVELVSVALLLAVLLGVPLGLLSAAYQDSWVDTLSRLVAVPGVALPRFWVGIVLQIGLAYQLGLFPLVGRAARPPPRLTGLHLPDALLAGDPRALLDALSHLALPAVTLALPTLAQVARLTRASMIEVFRRPYMLVHQAYGIPPRRLVWRYGLRNGLTSVLTLLGMTYGALIENAFLVEVVFSWPGLSAYGAAAVLAKDFNAVVGVTLVVGLSFVLANLAVDVLYAHVDPRVSHP